MRYLKAEYLKQRHTLTHKALLLLVAFAPWIYSLTKAANFWHSAFARWQNNTGFKEPLVYFLTKGSWVFAPLWLIVVPALWHAAISIDKPSKAHWALLWWMPVRPGEVFKSKLLWTSLCTIILWVAFSLSLGGCVLYYEEELRHTTALDFWLFCLRLLPVLLLYLCFIVVLFLWFPRHWPLLTTGSVLLALLLPTPPAYLPAVVWNRAFILSGMSLTTLTVFWLLLPPALLAYTLLIAQKHALFYYTLNK
ncbi:MAG: hypothetical protein KatS3mg033_2274 [Thermonema sp.]|jgi:hypothetical protein|uniref:hypothetical protein n=1 Tax=Thermonema TaxID=28194 RepID=UPI00056FC781|nr:MULTISPECIES: hypothetical protein [Thermonema]GIV40474.1 MAG: hypothetical protein KatS3mg033_2274 [Thermonema sp.]